MSQWKVQRLYPWRQRGDTWDLYNLCHYLFSSCTWSELAVHQLFLQPVRQWSICKIHQCLSSWCKRYSWAVHHTWAPCGHDWYCVISDWSKGPFFWHFKTANACFFSKVYKTMKFQLVCRKFQLVWTPIPERCDWSVQNHWSEGTHVCLHQSSLLCPL